MFCATATDCASPSEKDPLTLTPTIINLLFTLLASFQPQFINFLKKILLWGINTENGACWFSGMVAFYQYYINLHQINEIWTLWQQCVALKREETSVRRAILNPPLKSKTLGPNTDSDLWPPCGGRLSEKRIHKWRSFHINVPRVHFNANKIRLKHKSAKVWQNYPLVSVS